MTTKTCGALVGQVHSSIGDSLRQCSRKAKYYCTDVKKYYCAIHLKKEYAFSKNPICLENGREIDRHVLYKFRKIEFVKEDLK